MTTRSIPETCLPAPTTEGVTGWRKTMLDAPENQELIAELLHDLNTVDYGRQVWKQRLVEYRHGALPDHKAIPAPDTKDTFGQVFPTPQNELERAKARNAAAAASRVLTTVHKQVGKAA